MQRPLSAPRSGTCTIHTCMQALRHVYAKRQRHGARSLHAVPLPARAAGLPPLQRSRVTHICFGLTPDMDPTDKIIKNGISRFFKSRRDIVGR